LTELHHKVKTNILVKFTKKLNGQSAENIKAYLIHAEV